MSTSLYWMQSGGCGGDTMSVLNGSTPTFLEGLEALDIETLYHPSLSRHTPQEHNQLLDSLRNGKTKLGIFCLEGSVLSGPDGSGMFDTIGSTPRKDIIRELADRAELVIAVGTCGAYGGITAAGDADASGLQFNGQDKGGLLGAEFISKAGLPVINIPGCPVHPVPLFGTLSLLLRKGALELNGYNAPLEYFGMLVHQGCTRNEYHEYQVEETDFGERGCLFFHMGCHGPLAHGPCNKYLWNGRSCKTRSGVPCFGCTEPTFPQQTPFFETPNIVGLPINLPDGVDRPHYLAYKGMAAAAAPERLRYRKTKV